MARAARGSSQEMQMAKRVAVLAEGPQPLIADALAERGYTVTQLAPIDLPAQLATRPDVVFNALTSTLGHDGRVQGLLELLGIAYTHSGVLASALAAHRHQAKVMLRAAGLPVTDHMIVDRAEAAGEHQMAPPYVVKPLMMGAREPALLVGRTDPPPVQLISADWRGGEEVMVERFVPGRTLDVAVMGGIALSVSETLVKENGPELAVPAAISPNIYEKLQKMSLKAHETLGCRGVTRTRFRYNELASGETGLVCLAVDTQPELLPGASVAAQALYAGHAFSELVAWMVEDASCNR
jgi:D-alanine-D-alanine ligase